MKFLEAEHLSFICAAFSALRESATASIYKLSSRWPHRDSGGEVQEQSNFASSRFQLPPRGDEKVLVLAVLDL